MELNGEENRSIDQGSVFCPSRLLYWHVMQDRFEIDYFYVIYGVRVQMVAQSVTHSVLAKI